MPGAAAPGAPSAGSCRHGAPRTSGLSTRLIRTCRESRGPEAATVGLQVSVSAAEVIILRYDLGMSDRKSRLTITVDPDLSTYAERLVASGHAASVSAAFNEVMAEKAYRDRRRRGMWKAKGDQADPGRVARMMAHVDQQLAGE